MGLQIVENGNQIVERVLLLLLEEGVLHATKALGLMRIRGREGNHCLLTQGMAVVLLLE
jgi:hypothetical protein